MPSIDDEAKRWQLELAARVGRAVQGLRKDQGWTAAELSRRCAELGYPISRVAISKIESNSRAGKVDLAELLVLAAALGVPAVMLMYPELPDGDVEVLPGVHGSSIRALVLTGGHQVPGLIPTTDPQRLLNLSLDVFWKRITHAVDLERLEAYMRSFPTDAPDDEVAAAADRIMKSVGARDEISALEDEIRSLPGSVVQDDA